ncbi:hypothetical protein [Mesorhizobium sp.]|uniref:hypothetical protein n=1 Tax=Mesorhizobium sp. TaxID=1871066 RepID=UPI0025C62B1B|nr:hypothetical protein [Mesorhizobium sp.]
MRLALQLDLKLRIVDLNLYRSLDNFGHVLAGRVFIRKSAAHVRRWRAVDDRRHDGFDVGVENIEIVGRAQRC